MKPRLKAAELALELTLTRGKYLMVEGPSDRRFYSQWLDKIASGGVNNIVVTAIDDVDIPSDALESLNLNEGNRSRVIFFSTLVKNARKALCIADLDCGAEFDRFQSECLVWTDFPALESYGVSAAVFDTLNRSFLGERLPSGSDVISLIEEPLEQLYRVRRGHPHLQRPNIEKGIQKNGNAFSDFSLARTVPADVASDFMLTPRLTYNDLREVSYGHDICALIISIYGNIIKNQAGFSKQEMLESVFRASILLEGSHENLPLFVRLRGWALS